MTPQDNRMDRTRMSHLDGLCLRPARNGSLQLADCAGDFVRLAEEADMAMEEGELFLGEFVLKLGSQCVEPRSAQIAEPQLLLAPCHQRRHLQIFRALKAGTSEMFILQHKASRNLGEGPTAALRCGGFQQRSFDRFPTGGRVIYGQACCGTLGSPSSQRQLFNRLRRVPPATMERA
eukprot:s3542_g7.t1